MLAHGGYFDWDTARAVKVGMTESQVIDLLGKPNSVVTATPNTQRWTYRYTLWGGKSGWVVYPFKDGKVAAIPNLPFD